MAIKTRVTEMLGIEHPIVQGGMMHVGYAELASAVSNAGGLGTLTALTQPSPEALAAEIERCRGMTAKPFAVNITVLPSITPPDYKAFAQVVIDAGIKIVETAGTAEVRELWAMMKPHGITVLHKCTAVRHALSAERNGCDIISIDGFECAGHPGEDDVPGLVLIPAAADKEIENPDDRLGRDSATPAGWWPLWHLAPTASTWAPGSCATVEVAYPSRTSSRPSTLTATTSCGTELIFRSLHNTARVGKNGVSDEVVQRLKEPGAKFEDVRELVMGKKGAEMLKSGDTEHGIFWAGMIQGLIHDIPTCEDLISGMVRDAEAIIKSRLGGMLA